MYHAASRGDLREDIYEGDSDRLDWLAIFGEVCKRFNRQTRGHALQSNRSNVGVILFGLVCIASGALLIAKGTVWNLSLGDKKYLVGGVMSLYGLYALVRGILGR